MYACVCKCSVMQVNDRKKLNILSLKCNDTKECFEKFKYFEFKK